MEMVRGIGKLIEQQSIQQHALFAEVCGSQVRQEIRNERPQSEAVEKAAAKMVARVEKCFLVRQRVGGALAGDSQGGFTGKMRKARKKKRNQAIMRPVKKAVIGVVWSSCFRRRWWRRSSKSPIWRMSRLTHSFGSRSSVLVASGG